MRNKVLSTMEDSFANANERSGGSYSYKLTYRNPKGEDKIILTNEVVSGDKGTGETKGLFDATDATGEWFFLEDLAPNATAWMMLEVSIDGETHGNTYFDTDASVQLAFAAEPTEERGHAGQPRAAGSRRPQAGSPQEGRPEERHPEGQPAEDHRQGQRETVPNRRHAAHRHYRGRGRHRRRRGDRRRRAQPQEGS